MGGARHFSYLKAETALLGALDDRDCADEPRLVTLVTDRKQPGRYCLSQIDELPASTNKRSAMTLVLTRKNAFFGLAALAISAGLVVTPALQEANAAETIVADAARVGEGKRHTRLKTRYGRLSGGKYCWWHRHKWEYHPAGWRRPLHKHCHDTRVRRPGHPR